MAIITKEQGSVDYGGSSGRFSPVDTYARPAADSGSGDTANQLARSLAQFANLTSDWTAERKVERAKETELKFTKMVEDVERDSANGLSYMAAAQKLYPQESPVLHARLVSAAASNTVERDLYPRYSELFADQATLSDPTALQARLDGIRSDYLANKKGRDDFETAAYIKGFDAWMDKVKGDAVKTQSESLRAAGREAFERTTDPRLIVAQNTVASASNEVGIDPKFTFAVLKSYNPFGDPTARNQYQGQTASGLMDITDGTWSYLVGKYGKQFGVSLDQKDDPRASALMGAAYAKELYTQISQAKGREASVGEVNAAYMLGFAGFQSFQEKLAKNPDVPMDQVVGRDVFKVNSGFFTDKKEGRVLTAREAMAKWESGIPDTLQATKRYDGVAPFKMDKNSFASTQGYLWTDFKNDGKYGGDGQIDGRMVNLLDKVTEQFGRGKLSITSAFRSDKYDADIGGAGNHPHGDALDIDVSKMSNDDKKRLVALFVANGARGVGHYANGTIHVDLGTGREASGKQGDDVQTWAKGFSPQPWFTSGVDEGKQYRTAGYAPVTGFNGQGVNGFDLRVREAHKYGMMPKDARDLLFTNLAKMAEANRDASILDSIPDGSITAEQRSIKTELQQKIPKLVLQDMQFKDSVTQTNRRKAIDERESAILEATSKGELINPDKMSSITYKDADGKEVTARESKLFDMAQKFNEADRVDSRTSQAYAIGLADKIESMFTQNDPGEMFKDIPSIQRLIDSSGGKVPSESDIKRAILFDPNLNKTERNELLKAVPNMASMFTVVQDKAFVDSTKPVQSSVDIYMKTDTINKFAAQRNPEVSKLFQSLAANVENFQRNEYLSYYKAWHKDNPGQQIPELTKLEYIKKAQAEAQTFFDKQKKVIDEAAKLPLPTNNRAGPSEDPFKVGTVIPQGTITGGNSKAVIVKPADGGDPIVIKREELKNIQPTQAAKPSPQPASTAPTPVATPTQPSKPAQAPLLGAPSVPDVVQGISNFFNLTSEQRAALPQIQQQAVDALRNDPQYNQLVELYNSVPANERGKAYGEIARYYGTFVKNFVDNGVAQLRTSSGYDPKK